MSVLDGVQRRSRAEKYAHFISMLSPTKDDTVLVLGAGDGHDELFRRYPWKDRLVAVDHNPKSLTRLKQQYPMVRCVVADLCVSWPFTTSEFSIGYMNAVLEHLPDPEYACAELRRVCVNYWTATPHYWFPFDMHTRLPFYHWLPESLQKTIIYDYRPGRYKDGIHEPVKPITKGDVHTWLPDAHTDYAQNFYTVLAYTPRYGGTP
jgi:SAM-dependent methyltransferase